MIKIFSPNKIIYLISSKPTVKLNKNSIFIEIQSKDELRLKYFEVINKKDLNEIYFYNSSLENLFTFFADQFRLIDAAGGLVKNDDGKWLFIFRNGKWDLPKGKIEKGEAVKKAAIREVEEECGIGKLKIINELPSTYHTYFMNGQEILKRTYWFEMFSDDNNTLTPQIEEGITEVKWIATKDLKQVYDNTFESVKEVLKEIA
jgi:8-oxo-dGTP pyrophosphatase MutT (NUDIX family)